MTSIKSAVRKAAQRGFRTLGVEVLPKRENYHYVPDFYGRSARKSIDIRKIAGFGELARTVISQGRTLLYYDRLYTIYQELQRVAATQGAGPVNIAEVGVFRGGTTYFIASTVKQLGLNGAQIHSFDTFEGHAAVDLQGGKDAKQYAGAFADTGYDAVKSYLKGFSNVTLYKGRVQDTAGAVGERTFNFVHLDVDIYEPTKYGLEFFGQRLVVGGAIVVDDYGFLSCPGAKQAVDEFVAGHPNYSPLHLLTGQCVLVKYQQEGAK